MGTLVNVPVYLSAAIEKEPTVPGRFLKDKYPGVKIIRPKVLLNHLAVYDGSELRLQSCTEAQSGREQCLSALQMKMIYRLMNTPESRWNYTDDDLNELIADLLDK